MSDFRLSKPRWWYGIARLLDLAGRFDDGYYRRLPDTEVDARALYSDWMQVGKDIEDTTKALTASGKD